MPALTPVFQSEIKPGSVFSAPCLDWSHPVSPRCARKSGSLCHQKREMGTPEGKPAHPACTEAPVGLPRGIQHGPEHHQIHNESSLHLKHLGIIGPKSNQVAAQSQGLARSNPSDSDVALNHLPTAAGVRGEKVPEFFLLPLLQKAAL